MSENETGEAQLDTLADRLAAAAQGAAEESGTVLDFAPSGGRRKRAQPAAPAAPEEPAGPVMDAGEVADMVDALGGWTAALLGVTPPERELADKVSERAVPVLEKYALHFDYMAELLLALALLAYSMPMVVEYRLLGGKEDGPLTVEIGKNDE